MTIGIQVDIHFLEFYRNANTHTYTHIYIYIYSSHLFVEPKSTCKKLIVEPLEPTVFGEGTKLFWRRNQVGDRMLILMGYR